LRRAYHWFRAVFLDVMCVSTCVWSRNLNKKTV